MKKLLEKLELRLKKTLPGANAHNMMVPRLSAGNNVRFSQATKTRRGAVLILLYPTASGIQFPLIQRPLYDGVHSGQMALPGGKVEPQDRHLIDTALRETQEEIGVPIDAITVIGQLSEFMVSASNHLVLPVVGYTDSRPNFIPDPTEVSEVIEAGLSELLDPDKVKSKEITTAHGYKLHSPYFDLQGKVVWGATAMMLSEFVEVIRDINDQ